jgi:hypothetical protein
MRSRLDDACAEIAKFSVFRAPFWRKYGEFFGQNAPSSCAAPARSRLLSFFGSRLRAATFFAARMAHVAVTLLALQGALT